MKLKHLIKFVLLMICIGYISLSDISFIKENNRHTTVVNDSSSLIIEYPKRPNTADSEENINDQGTRVETPSKYNDLESPIQPLPIPSPNQPIKIIPLN